MADLATVCLTGRITRDAKTRQAGNNTVTEFSLAVNHWKEGSVSFFNVEAWGKLGEIILRYGVKGKQIALQGDIRIDTWDKDGVKQYKTVIEAKNITLLGSKKDEAPVKVALTNEIPF